MTTYLYSVAYRRDPLSRRVHRMTVEARDTDEARRIVAALDPKYTATIRSPERRGQVVRA